MAEPRRRATPARRLLPAGLPCGAMSSSQQNALLPTLYPTASTGPTYGKEVGETFLPRLENHVRRCKVCDTCRKRLGVAAEGQNVVKDNFACDSRIGAKVDVAHRSISTFAAGTNGRGRDVLRNPNHRPSTMVWSSATGASSVSSPCYLPILPHVGFSHTSES